MAKDFNVYQWRRQHLNENQVSEEKSWKKDFEEIMDTNNLTKGEIMDFISIYFKDEKGKPINVSLNEELEIGQEYTKEEVANMFDQIYWKATNKLDKNGILALPSDKIRYMGMYPSNSSSALPNFVSPKGPEPKFTMPDSAAAVRGATATSNNLGIVD